MTRADLTVKKGHSIPDVRVLLVGERKLRSQFSKIFRGSNWLTAISFSFLFLQQKDRFLFSNSTAKIEIYSWRWQDFFNCRAS